MQEQYGDDIYLLQVETLTLLECNVDALLHFFYKPLSYQLECL
jgi:hypothetical protein